MFLTDMYKIVKSDKEVICFDRPIFPDIIIYSVIGTLAAFLMFFVWDKPNLRPWFWFSAIGLSLMVFGLVYILFPDKRITLEDKGSIFILRGKHWFSKRNATFSSEGSMAALRVTGSGGENAMNFVLEVKTLDGLRFMTGFHSFGSFQKDKLEELGRFLEERTEGRLVLTHN